MMDAGNAGMDAIPPELVLVAAAVVMFGLLVFVVVSLSERGDK